MLSWHTQKYWGVSKVYETFSNILWYVCCGSVFHCGTLLDWGTIRKVWHQVSLQYHTSLLPDHTHCGHTEPYVDQQTAVRRQLGLISPPASRHCIRSVTRPWPWHSWDPWLDSGTGCQRNLLATQYGWAIPWGKSPRRLQVTLCLFE